MTTVHQIPEGRDQFRPVQFLTIGDQAQIPAPLIRITTCGLLMIEIVEEIVSTDPPLARYASLTPEQLRGRGTGPALMLLKLFLNRHERFASREWLLEQFCRNGEVFSSVRIDNIVSMLRSLLCPSIFPTTKELRMQMVAHVRSSSGDGYQLALYPLIWVDQDALIWHVEQAARMERFGDDALPFWERAYEIARRGPYLPDESYVDWVSFQREQVAGMLRQSVQALARLYQARHGAAGEEEALLLLRSFWQEHPREEDILRPLMELLGRRECYHEALQYYEQLCYLLKEDECQPDSQTQDVATYLQTKLLQRAAYVAVPSIQSKRPSLTLVSPETSLAWKEQNRWNRELQAPSYETVSFMTGLEASLGMHLDPAHYNQFMQLLDTLKIVLDTSPRPGVWHQMMSLPVSANNCSNDEMESLQKLLNYGWEFRNTGELEIARQIIISLLSKLFQYSPSHPEIASLLAEGLRLHSILTAHQQRLSDKLAFCLQSVEYARQSRNPSILSAELTELAVAFEYAEQPKNAFGIYQEALPLANHASPLIRSRLYGRSAIAFAREGQMKQAYAFLHLASKSFPPSPEAEPDFLSSDHGLHKLARHKGLVHLAAGNLEKATEAFESINNYPAPAASKLESLNDLGRTAIQSKHLDRYAYCLEEGLNGSLLLKSAKRIGEVLQTFHKEVPKAWLREAPIRAIAERFQLQQKS